MGSSVASPMATLSSRDMDGLSSEVDAVVVSGWVEEVGNGATVDSDSVAAASCCIEVVAFEVLFVPDICSPSCTVTPPSCWRAASISLISIDVDV